MRNLVMVFSALALGNLSADFALSYGHANAFGGSTSHSWGTIRRTVGYATAHRPPGGAYAYGYHPPTTVGYYGAGCYNCGGNPVGVAVTGAAGGAIGRNAVVSNELLAPAPSYAIGVNMAALPEDCLTTVVHGGTYYLCGNSWFSPFYGASAVYYQVVPAP